MKKLTKPQQAILDKCKNTIDVFRKYGSFEEFVSKSVKEQHMLSSGVYLDRKTNEIKKHFRFNEILNNEESKELFYGAINDAIVLIYENDGTLREMERKGFIKIIENGVVVKKIQILNY